MAEVADYDNTRRGIQSAKEPVQVMGSEPVTLAASGESTFTFEPDYDMNFESFRVEDRLKAGVAVVGMKIGPVSVMAGAGPFPLDAFGPGSTLRLALALPIKQNAPLKVTVRNMTTSSIPGFYLGITGKVKRAG